MWVRARQADDSFLKCGTGLLGDAAGAIAYDDAALARARGIESQVETHRGIEVEKQDEFRRTSAQALPSLAYAPAGGTPRVTAPGSRLRRAGSAASVVVKGLAPGQTVCIQGTGPDDSLTNADATGTAQAVVSLPDTTRTARYRVGTATGALGGVSFQTLAATTPRLTYKQRPKRGTSQRVVVAGLVSDESVVVRSAGRVVARGTVNDAGRYVARFKVGSKLGKKGVTVTGEFGNRRASQSFVVVKGR